jgi:hypothetical protein
MQPTDKSALNGKHVETPKKEHRDVCTRPFYNSSLLLQ